MSTHTARSYHHQCKRERTSKCTTCYYVNLKTITSSRVGQIFYLNCILYFITSEVEGYKCGASYISLVRIFFNKVNNLTFGEPFQQTQQDIITIGAKEREDIKTYHMLLYRSKGYCFACVFVQLHFIPTPTLGITDCLLFSLNSQFNYAFKCLI